MDVSVLAEAVELSEHRVPYVLATVVWRRGPSSGRQGSKAVVLADGTVRGWLGGACAEPSVVRHARQCLQTGEPALLFLGQPDELDGRSQEGVRSTAMACESSNGIHVSPMTNGCTLPVDGGGAGRGCGALRAARPLRAGRAT